MTNILIADDEKEIIQLLSIYLEKDDVTIYEAYDGESAYKILSQTPIDLAIIDIMMPRLNGFELIKKVRSTMNVPIIVLSAKVNLTDRVLGLNLGADDYMTKPFEPLELVAKVNSILRRVRMSESTHTSSSLTIRNLTLHINECLLEKDNIEIPLTKIEFNILKLLMESPGRVFTKDQIYEAAWGNDYVVDDNTIRVMISHLRDKVGGDNITTIRGLGYRLEKECKN